MHKDLGLTLKKIQTYKEHIAIRQNEDQCEKRHSMKFVFTENAWKLTLRGTSTGSLIIN